MTDPIPASFENEYRFADIEPTLPQFSITPSEQSKYYVPVSHDTKSEDSEDEDDEQYEDSAPLDVIAVKQFHQSKMDITHQLYVGSLTVLGLYILYKYLRK